MKNDLYKEIENLYSENTISPNMENYYYRDSGSPFSYDSFLYKK